MPIDVTDNSAFDVVRTPATGDPGSQAVFLECFQTLANRTRYLLDNLPSGGVALAANQVHGRSSAGAEAGKACTDASFALLALASSAAWGDALHVKAADLPSATTTNLGAVAGQFVHVTGNTTITSFGTVAAGTRRRVVFDGALVLTHSANLILPTGASIAVEAGDTLDAVSEGGGVWRVTHYTRADGTPLVSAGLLMLSRVFAYDDPDVALAATQARIKLATLPVGARIVAINVDQTTAFDNSVDAFSLDVGIHQGAEVYAMPIYTAGWAISDGGFDGLPAPGLTYAGHASGVEVAAQIASDGGNLSTLTAGLIKLAILYTVPTVESVVDAPDS